MCIGVWIDVHTIRPLSLEAEWYGLSVSVKLPSDWENALLIESDFFQPNPTHTQRLSIFRDVAADEHKGKCGTVGAQTDKCDTFVCFWHSSEIRWTSWMRAWYSLFEWDTLAQTGADYGQPDSVMALILCMFSGPDKHKKRCTQSSSWVIGPMNARIVRGERVEGAELAATKLLRFSSDQIFWGRKRCWTEWNLYFSFV